MNCSKGAVIAVAIGVAALLAMSSANADVVLDDFSSGSFSLGSNGSASGSISSLLGPATRTVTTSANWSAPRALSFSSSASGTAVMDYLQLGAAPSGPAITGISIQYSGLFNITGASTISLLGSGVFSDHGQGSGHEIFRFVLELSDGSLTKAMNINMPDGQFHSLGNLTWNLGDPSFSGLNWSSITSIKVSYSGYNNKVSGNGSELNYTTTGLSVGGITVAAVPGSGVAVLSSIAILKNLRRRRRCDRATSAEGLDNI